MYGSEKDQAIGNSSMNESWKHVWNKKDRLHKVLCAGWLHIREVQEQAEADWIRGGRSQNCACLWQRWGECGLGRSRENFPEWCEYLYDLGAGDVFTGWNSLSCTFNCYTHSLIEFCLSWGKFLKSSYSGCFPLPWTLTFVKCTSTRRTCVWL